MIYIYNYNICIHVWYIYGISGMYKDIYEIRDVPLTLTSVIFREAFSPMVYLLIIEYGLKLPQ